MLTTRRLGLAVLAAGLSVSPAMAMSDVFAAPKQTTAVAAFPDALPVTPGAPAAVPKPRSDPSEELLRQSPYPRPGTRGPAKGRDVNIANPYVEELRLVHSEAVQADNPYVNLAHPEPTGMAPGSADDHGGALKDPYSSTAPDGTGKAPGVAATSPSAAPTGLKNPYTDAQVAPRAQAFSSELRIEPRGEFQGVILIDGISAPRDAAFPLAAGPHTVSVFPKEGRPYQVPVYVRPDRTERVVIP